MNELPSPSKKAYSKGLNKWFSLFSRPAKRLAWSPVARPPKAPDETAQINQQIRLAPKPTGTAAALSLLLLALWILQSWLSFLLPDFLHLGAWLSSLNASQGQGFNGSLFYYSAQLPLWLLAIATVEAPFALWILGFYIIGSLIGLPLLTYGGGLKLLTLPTLGYLLGLIPATWLMLKGAWFFSRLKMHPLLWMLTWLGFSLILMGMIHISGGIYTKLLLLSGHLTVLEANAAWQQLTLNRFAYDWLLGAFALAIVCPLRMLFWVVLY